MHTDYKNINSFEVATVGVIMIGFVLVGAMLFASLTPRVQNHVAGAVSVLDLHQDLAVAVDNLKFVMSIPNEFNQEFYLAFTQVASLPEIFMRPPQTIRRGYQALANYSDQVTSNYFAVATVQPRISGGGKILGTMIERLATMPKVSASASSDLCDEPEQSSEDFLQAPDYNYIPPDLRSFESGIKKLLNFR